ncbi:MAG: hypothetical protein CMB96_04155 [Flavobacteriaceae bacterium]|nr:hypothetical protein [Flavobacteriaceae bacterium]
MNKISIFRIIAFLEGLSYISLLFVAVPIKYISNDPGYVKMLGMPHGLLFIAYIILALVLVFYNNWVKRNLLGVLVASVIPFGTFVVDYKLKKTLNKA